MKIGQLFSKQSSISFPAQQLFYDYSKHMTTLSLGAILFISAFIKTGETASKASADHQVESLLQQISIAASVVGFLISIYFSLRIMKYISKSVNTFASAEMISQWFDHFVENEEKTEKIKELPSKTNEEYFQELEKIGKQIKAFSHKADKEVEAANKKTRYAWVAFLIGLFSAIGYIATPIIGAIIRRLF